MALKRIGEIKENKDLTNKAKVNLKNIVKVIRSIIYKFIIVPLTPHIKEQIIFRTVLAKDCFLNKKCLYCGCHMYGVYDKRYDPGACNKKYDNLPFCYDEFMSKKDWQEFKDSIDMNAINKLYLEIIKSK